MTGQRFHRCEKCGYPNELFEVRKSVLDRFGRFVLGVAAVGTFVVAAFSLLAPTESTDIGKARAFLGAYYGNAPFQPERTWRRLTESYKENNADLTWDVYDEYFSQFSEMTVSDVANYETERGEWYAASVFRKNKNGDTATTRYAFDLRCPWYSRLPVLDCSASNLQIANNCEIDQQSGRCDQDENVN